MIDDGETFYLFAYGTLQRGLSTPVIKQIEDAIEWRGYGQVYGHLYDLGDYPGAVRTENSGATIRGDVIRLLYPVEVLAILDLYEGFDPVNPLTSDFLRQKEMIQIDDGTRVLAWMYWYNKEVTYRAIIQENDYLHYLKKKNKRGTSYGALQYEPEP